MRLLVALAMVALAAVGCTGSQAGTPPAEPSSTLTSAPASTTSSGSRPRPLDLNGIDPCTLLTQQQVAAFAVDRPLRGGTEGGASVLAGSPKCGGMSLQQQHGFAIIISIKMGLPEFVAKILANRSRSEIAVDGYPAVQYEGLTSAPERGSGECYVNVDVADGQFLRVQFSQIAASPDKRLPLETLCAKAREVAAAALTTLQGG